MTTEKKGFDLADKLKEVSKLNIGLQEQPQLEYIDIDLIDPDPRNRKVEGIPELAQNIALVGLQQPLAVRANPDTEGRYMAISGHRRRLAIKRLVDEGEERFRLVPCLVAPPGMSDAMVRLMILSGNMVTQGLTSAQMADATKEMEDAIYQLKEEGHEFPGKVRDYVAKACGIAGSRVTRLKGIRKNLAEPWVAHWESGELAESSAYTLSKLPEELQYRTYELLVGRGQINVKTIPEWKFNRVSDSVDRLEAIAATACFMTGKGKCSMSEHRMDTFIRNGQYDLCTKCCHGCPKLDTCPDACPELAAEAAALKAEKANKKAAEAERFAKEKADTQAAQEKWLRFTEAGWHRLGDALKYAKKDQKWLAEELGWAQSGDDVSARAELLDGAKITGDNKWWGEDHPLQDLDVEALAEFADALGVSLDYLFGRTDEPGMSKAERPRASVPSVSNEPTWQTGIPKHTGTYYCRIRLEAGQIMTLNLDYGTFNARWSHPATGEDVPYEVLGWWPLPEDDPEDAEDDNEGDDEDSMDALWYGHEDDDDYLAESSEVLGAEE